MQVIIFFLPTSICVLHSNFWYLHINSLLEWRFYYFHMFRNPVNQFMQLNPFPAVKTFTWTGAERHAWRNRYWRSRGQIVYRRSRRNGARLLQRTLCEKLQNYRKLKISGEIWSTEEIWFLAPYIWLNTDHDQKTCKPSQVHSTWLSVFKLNKSEIT